MDEALAEINRQSNVIGAALAAADALAAGKSIEPGGPIAEVLARAVAEYRAAQR